MKILVYVVLFVSDYWVINIGQYLWCYGNSWHPFACHTLLWLHESLEVAHKMEKFSNFFTQTLPLINPPIFLVMCYKKLNRETKTYALTLSEQSMSAICIAIELNQAISYNIAAWQDSQEERGLRTETEKFTEPQNLSKSHSKMLPSVWSNILIYTLTAAEKLLLAVAMQKKRLHFCKNYKKWISDDKKEIMFSNESTFQLITGASKMCPSTTQAWRCRPSSICMTSRCGPHSVEIVTKHISISYHFERKIILMFWRNSYFGLFVSMDASISCMMVLLPIGLWLWRISWSSKDQCIGVSQKLHHTSVQQTMLGPTWGRKCNSHKWVTSRTCKKPWSSSG